VDRNIFLICFNRTFLSALDIFILTLILNKLKVIPNRKLIQCNLFQRKPLIIRYFSVTDKFIVRVPARALHD